MKLMSLFERNKLESQWRYLFMREAIGYGISFTEAENLSTTKEVVQLRDAGLSPIAAFNSTTQIEKEG